MASCEEAVIRSEVGQDIDWGEYNIILTEVENEIDQAVRKFPWWPQDPIHAAGIVVEEAGELVQAAQNFNYHSGRLDAMRREAVQTAAMAIRFLRHFDRLTIHKSDYVLEIDS